MSRTAICSSLSENCGEAPVDVSSMQHLHWPGDLSLATCKQPSDLQTAWRPAKAELRSASSPKRRSAQLRPWTTIWPGPETCCYSGAIAALAQQQSGLPRYALALIDDSPIKQSFHQLDVVHDRIIAPDLAFHRLGRAAAVQRNQRIPSALTGRRQVLRCVYQSPRGRDRRSRQFREPRPFGRRDDGAGAVRRLVDAALDVRRRRRLLRVAFGRPMGDGLWNAAGQSRPSGNRRASPRRRELNR